MATSTLYFSGDANWAKLQKPDTKFNPDGEYKIDVFLDQANLKKFADSQIQLKIRYADDGRPYVTFKRAVKKLIKGELVILGAPQMLDKDSNPMDPNTVIGNGSVVTVKVTTYDGAKGKAHRLEAVRVDNLIPYGEVNKDVPDDGQPF